MSIIHLQAFERDISEAEIRAMVSPDTLARLKGMEDTPLIRVYGVGHEGKVKGKIVGLGTQAIQYFRDAIIRLTDRLPLGLKVFRGHEATNDHAGREQIGQVVGKAAREIGGQLYALAAVHIFNAHKETKLDVASIEADAAFVRDGENVRVQDFRSITGLALGDSAVDSPGFPGATLLGAMQAFADDNPEKGDATMTLDELKVAIKEGKFTPGQLFEESALIADPAVKTHVRKEKQEGHEHARRIEEKLGDERSARAKADKEHDAELAKMRGENIKASQGKSLETLATNRKLSDSQKRFLDHNLADFKSEAKTKEDTQKDFDKWADEHLESFKSIMGESAEQSKEKEGGKGAPSGDDEQGGDGSMSDPKENDFIPKAAV